MSKWDRARCKDQPMWAAALPFPRAPGRKEKISKTAAEEMTKKEVSWRGAQTERKASVWGTWEEFFRNRKEVSKSQIRGRL